MFSTGNHYLYVRLSYRFGYKHHFLFLIRGCKIYPKNFRCVAARMTHLQIPPKLTLMRFCYLRFFVWLYRNPDINNDISYVPMFRRLFRVGIFVRQCYADGNEKFLVLMISRRNLFHVSLGVQR